MFALISIYDEWNNVQLLGFRLDPLVAAIASAVPIVTLYWPFRPKHRSKRMKATITIDGTYRKIAEMGDGESKFIVSLSAGSDVTSHLYFTDPSIGGAFVTTLSRFDSVKNAAIYALSKESQMANRGDIVVLKNRFGNFCLLILEEIEAKNRNGATRDAWTISYVINPTGGLNFS